MGDHRAAAAAAGQHWRTRWTPGEARPSAARGRHLLSGPGRSQLARTAPGVPPRSTVWGTFTRWLRSAAWARVHDALRDRLRIRLGRRPQPSAAIIDSQSVRAADTVGGGSRGYDAGKKINGRKRHL